MSQDSFEVDNDTWLGSLLSVKPRPPQIEHESVLYVAAILAEDWLVDTHSYDLEALKAHYKATLWTEHGDSITGNAEWFGESGGVLFVIITATKELK